MCWKAWKVSWLCGTRERSSPAKRRRPAQAYSEASTDLPRTGTPTHGGLNGLGRRWDAALAALDTGTDITDADDTAVDNGTVRVRKAPDRSSRRPTPLQTARWNAVQKAKRRGLSIRGVAREVGIHRDTAKKYMEAVSPPMKRDRVG